jgi:hypothetical protein
VFSTAYPPMTRASHNFHLADDARRLRGWRAAGKHQRPPSTAAAIWCGMLLDDTGGLPPAQANVIMSNLYRLGGSNCAVHIWETFGSRQE